MVKEEEKETEDFTPREYQVEIFKRAIKENTIVFLPTGSGKTFIAIMLIKHYLEDIIIPYEEGGKRSVFLSVSRPLVKQQALMIRSIMRVNVGEYTSCDGVDNWTEEEWIRELKKNEVLVMTVQIFYNLLTNGIVKISQISVLILDECHRATRNHPMRLVMDFYNQLRVESRPRVLGLTATLINSDVTEKKTMELIAELEKNLNAKVFRPDSFEISFKYMANPDEFFTKYNENAATGGIWETIDEIICNLEYICDNIIIPKSVECPVGFIYLEDTSKGPEKVIKRSLRDAQFVCQNLGLYGGNIAFLHQLIMLEKMKSVVTNEDLYLLLCDVTTQLHFIRSILMSILGDNELDTILKYSSDKTHKLINLLKTTTRESSIIIFAERRSVVFALYNIIKVLSEKMPQFSHISCNFIVSCNAKFDSLENAFVVKKNKYIMDRFRAKEFNVLISTDVIEEGIDIQDCNLVAKFDHPRDIRSYIQSKGRARQKGSKYTIFIPSDSPFISKFYEYKKVESLLKKPIVTEIERINSLLDDEDDRLYVFSPQTGTNAFVTGITSIPLINRYCNALPHDKFSSLAPNWWYKKVSECGEQPKYIVMLLLPFNSQIKTQIEGPPRKSIQSAKRLTALLACELLYKAGELDDNLLPRGSKSILIDDCTVFPNWINNATEKSILVGTNRFTRVYRRGTCPLLYDCRPQMEKDVFMHVIKISPQYDRPKNTRYIYFFNLFQKSETFGIITSKPWVELSSFELFLRDGGLKISFLMNQRVNKLTSKELQLIDKFHFLVFSELLHLTQSKESYVLKDDSKVEDFYIVPVLLENNECLIDWATLKDDYLFPRIMRIPENERKGLVVTEEGYLGKLVIPWYRAVDLNGLTYVVTDICSDLNAKSPFPCDDASKSFNDYEMYFNVNYNVSVVAPEQPLLDVRAIPNKLELLLPRGKSKRNRLHDGEIKHDEKLVAELCILLNFPAVYRLKAVFLPSILHRVHQILLCNHFKETVSNELNLPFNQGGDLVFDNNVKMSKAEEEEEEADSNNDTLSEEQLPFFAQNDPADIYRDLNVTLTDIIHFTKMTNKPILNRVIGQNKDKPVCRKPEDVKTVKLSLLTKNVTEGGPDIADLLSAFTSVNAKDVMNYERMESLGDAFLKYVCSLALFICYPHLDEGKLTELKGKLVGNKHLLYCGQSVNIPSMINIYQFLASDWKIPGYKLIPEIKLKCLQNVVKNANTSYVDTDEVLNELNNKDEHRSVGAQKTPEYEDNLLIGTQDELLQVKCIPDKVVSDVVEALICVYLQSFGIEGGYKFVSWLGVLSGDLENYDRVLRAPPEDPLISDPSSSKWYLQLVCDIDFIEKTLGYEFKNKAFLIQALSHTSHSHRMTDCYQRLEFLGDAIIDFLLTAYIYEYCGSLSPGRITDLRSALVNNTTFACVVVRYNLHTCILSESCSLSKIISTFVSKMEKNDYETGYHLCNFIEENNVTAAEMVDSPKVLGDILESLVGAVFLDSGKDLEAAWRVTYRLLSKEIKLYEKNTPKNPIRGLYERYSAFQPQFGNCSEKGNKVIVPLEMVIDNKQRIFHGVGQNKSQAKVAAAKVALKALQRYS